MSRCGSTCQWGMFT